MSIDHYNRFDPQLKQLYVFLILWPAWWMLGIDQFVWIILILFGFLKVIGSKNKYPGEVVSTSNLKITCLLFFICALLSSVSLMTLPWYRIITYSFDIYFIIVGGYILFGMKRLDNSIIMQDKFIELMMKIIVISSILGIISKIWLPNFSFNSVFYYVFPDFVKNTDMGNHLLVKSLVSETSTWIKDNDLGKRLKGLSVSANSFASLATICIPFVIYQLTVTTKKTIGLLYLLSVIPALIFSFSRAFILTFIGTIFLIILIHALIIWLYSGKSILKFSVIVMCGMVCSYYVLDYFGIIDQIVIIFKKISLSKGSGSAQARRLIYIESIRAVLNRPWGFGTRVDLDYVRIPLGSHSTYISILFKYGFLGFIFYIIFLYKVLKTNIKGLAISYSVYIPSKYIHLRKKTTLYKYYPFFVCSFSSLFAITIGQITYDLSYDILTWIFFILICRISFAKYQQMNNHLLEMNNGIRSP